MNQEKNINKFKKLLPLIQAYIDGKEVELLSGEKWVHTDLNNICIDADRFRIKPEPKFRPFKNAEECWQEIRKHEPFIKYKVIESSKDVYLIIQRIMTDETDVERLYFETAFEWFTFADGLPFGVKVEE